MSRRTKLGLAGIAVVIVVVVIVMSGAKRGDRGQTVRIAEVGVEAIVFGSDFPHGEGLAFPAQYASAQLSNLPDDDFLARSDFARRKPLQKMTTPNMTRTSKSIHTLTSPE